MTDRHPRVAPGVVALAAMMVVSACAGSGSVGGSNPPRVASLPAVSSPTAAAPSVIPAGSTPPPSSGGSLVAPSVMLDQVWATSPLIDVATGETFRIADHAGTVIIIEAMAIWCANCRTQQADVTAALEQLPAGSVVFVALDVDPNEDGGSLAAYRAKNGFAGRYAIAGLEVARALSAEFGDQVLNPPSTPMVIVGTDGRVTLTGFGHKSVDQIVALAMAHGA